MKAADMIRMSTAMKTAIAVRMSKRRKPFLMIMTVMEYRIMEITAMVLTKSTIMVMTMVIMPVRVWSSRPR
jgi:hypothetical protein